MPNRDRAPLPPASLLALLILLGSGGATAHAAPAPTPRPDARTPAAYPAATPAHPSARHRPPPAGARPGRLRPAPLETVPPRLLTPARPPLPGWAAQRGVTGPVPLLLVVDEHGHVRSVKALSDPGPGLATEAIRVARTLRFVPAQLHGKPVRVQIRLALHFAPPRPAARSPQGAPHSPFRPRRVAAKTARARQTPARRSPARTRSARNRSPRNRRAPRKAAPEEYHTTVVDRRPLTAASDQTIRDLDFLLFPRQTPSDLLLMVPSLHISQHSGSGKGHQIFLRGFDAEHGKDIWVGFDGVPVNEPSHVHCIGYTDLHFLIPAMIQRMEILKGPYDVRYGDFAVAGAVNFVLRNRLEQSYVAVGGGSFRTLQATLAFTPPLKTLDAVVAVQGFTTNGYTAFGKWQGGRALGRLSRRLAGGRIAATMAYYASTWNAADAIPDRLVQSGNLDFYGGMDDSDGGSSERAHLSVTYRRKRGPTELYALAYLVQRRSRIYTNYTYFLDHPDTGDQTEQGDQRWTLGGRAEWTQAWRAGPVLLQLLSGATVRSDWIHLTRFQTEKRVRWDRGADVAGNLLNVGGYSRLEVTPVRWFRALAGLRYDYLWFDASGVQDLRLPSGAVQDDQPVNGASGKSVLSPKASLIFSPARTADIFLNFGTGFHSLDIRDAVLNPSQDIPLAYAGEVGFRLKLWKRLDLAGSLWGVYLEQEIFFDPMLGRSVDTGRSRRLGAELEARLQILSWLHLDLDGSYTDARLVDSGNFVPNSPRILVRGGFTVRKPFHSRVRFFDGSLLTAGVRVRYIGPRDLAGGHTSEDATLVDLLVGYRLRWFAVEIAVDNLLDSQWRDAQYFYTSRASLAEPDTGVNGFHFTAGTPFAIRSTLRVFFP